MKLASPTGMAVRLSRFLREGGRFYPAVLILFLLCTGLFCAVLPSAPSGGAAPSAVRFLPPLANASVHAERLECDDDASALEVRRREADDFVPMGRFQMSSNSVRQLFKSNTVHSPAQKAHAPFSLTGLPGVLTAARHVFAGTRPAVPLHYPSILKKVQPVRAGPVL